MYEEFFGLQRRPFSATPDAECFVPLETHQGVLDALAVSCERGQGIGVLTGEAGLGKSLVGLRLAFELQPTFAAAFLGHSAYATRRALLQAILFELNGEYDRKTEQELRLDLAAALKSLRPEKQGFVLVVDEAHRLSVPLLDELRLLTLLSDGGEPLTRVVLIGDRDLEERLADPELASFNQRVCCQVDLQPLTQAESLEYLRSNLEFAGVRAEDIFTEEALKFLAKAADGVPRCLNHLADHSLLLAYVIEHRPVTAEIVRDALDDLKQLPLHWNDPISGGEVYRGLSQRPPMEDSAVDLWPQHEQTSADESRESGSWDESAFVGSSAAIEIGGELEESSTDCCSPGPCGLDDSPSDSHQPSHKGLDYSELAEIRGGDATEQLTCLKDNWQAVTRLSSSVEDLLQSVTELTQTMEESQDSPTLGQVFDAQEFEFGAPSPQSFAVEEFAGDDDHSDFESSEGDRWSSPADDEITVPVWNLPERSWSVGDDRQIDFEEEPVIDRYVRIASRDGVVWNQHAPHTQAVANRSVTAVKTTRLVMAAALGEDSNESDGAHDSYESHQPQELDVDSGIVESYSRKPRDAGQISNLPIQGQDRAAAEDHGQVENLPHEKRDWHLPTELLKATLEDDGVEEQIGAEVLDLYLDVQQTLLDQHMASVRPAISLGRSKAEDVSRMADDFTLPARNEDVGERTESPRTTAPDAIQRAYGRLFSELRRKKR